MLSVLASLVPSALSPVLSPALAVEASALSLAFPPALAGAAGVSLAAVAVWESWASLALLCEDWSELLLRSDDEEGDDDELDGESLRRGALSWLEDGALLLMAWVLLSTRSPKGELGAWSLVCGRAGLACALETCALAATSDVLPTTGDPLKTSSAQEVSKERANP